MAESQGSVTASYGAAAGATKESLKAMVTKHPGNAVALIAALAVTAVVLIFMVSHYKSACQKSGFGVARINNLNTGSNSPLWWHGSGDAGWGGPVHREATAYHVAHYTPSWRATECRCCESPCSCGAATGALAPGGASHFTAPPAAPAPAPVMKAGAPDCGVGPSWGCGDSWDPAAAAEAAALSTVGALPHSAHGVRRLQGALDSAFECEGLTDCQLSQVMHQGGAP